MTDVREASGIELEDPSILPRRPLCLRREYVRAMRRRIAIVLGVAIATIIAAIAWPGVDLSRAMEVEDDWRRAEPLDVVRIDVQHTTALGVLHIVHASVVYRDATGERVAEAETFRGPWPPALTTSREARRDPATGRVLTSMGMASRWSRRGAAALSLSILVSLALVLLVAARRRALELAIARRAAVRSTEILLELHGPTRRGRYTFDAPSPEPARGGYRESARSARRTVVVRTRGDEPKPLLFGAERTHALALLTDRGEILVVREDLWPLELGSEESARVGRRIASWRASDQPH